jgi:hypothetical protein
VIRPLSRLRRVRRPPSVALAMALTLAACAPANPGPTASQLANPSPISSAESSSAPTATPAASSPAVASPVSSAAASPAASALACPVAAQSGLLPSDRLVDLAVSSTPTHDLLTFIFATSSPGPAGPPRGTLDAANPPFSFAGSGEPIELLGQHAVQIRFSAMTIASESGDATYHGPADVRPGRSALREAIQYDASEGIVGWYIGYDGPGCVTLVRDGNDVTVMIARPEAPAG